ncbi:MAG: HWE histidine kinase domain-containing protein [Rhizomicrobium sp.]
MSIGTAIRSMRAAVLTALVGSPDSPAKPAHGFGLAARIVLTVATFAVTLAVCLFARGNGIFGAAALFFPACLIVTLFAGWEFGAVVLVAAAALVWNVARTLLPATSLIVFGLAGVLQLALAGFVRALLRSAWHAERALQSLSERRAREAEARELVLGEARHRLKNLMAVIEALAKFSGSKKGEKPEVDEYLQRFLGRLRALGTASDLVLRHGFDVLEANAIVGAVLAPFHAGTPPRLHFEGPAVELSEQFASALALAVHELASNALKYGALSHAGGRVDFRWTATPEAGGERIRFVWSEQGGPAPQPAPKDGFGHRLIRSAISSEPEGDVRIDTPPEGLVCRIAYLRRGPTPLSPRSGR